MGIKCPKCHNINSRIDTHFCTFCGAEIAENHCSNEECKVFKESEILKGDECYCYRCGHKTTFYLEGKIDAYDDLPF